MADRVQIARRLSRRIKLLAQAARRFEAKMAQGLLEMEKRGLFRCLGYPRIEDYAQAELEISPSKTKDLIELAQRIRVLPQIASAFRAGEVPWTKCRQIARVATRQTEAGWVEKAQTMTNRELERAVAAAKGERPKVRVVIDLDEDDAADFDLAVRKLREERGEPIPLGAAVGELCRRAMGPPVDRPGYQVVIHECPTCGVASRDAREGPVEVAPAEAAAARTDAEVVDLGTPGAPVKRSISRAERRAVIARDHSRCALCGTMYWLHIHHLEPRPDGLNGFALLCSICHKKLIHGGHVSVRGEAPDIDFRLADGSAAPRFTRAWEARTRHVTSVRAAPQGPLDSEHRDRYPALATG